MATHANAAIDYESAPVTAGGLPPTHHGIEVAKKEKDTAYVNPQDVIVSAAADLDLGENEPSDEEYATLRK